MGLGLETGSGSVHQEGVRDSEFDRMLGFLDSEFDEISFVLACLLTD